MLTKLETEQIERLSPADFEQAAKFPVVVLLDNLRSMHNVGSAFRTADAFAIEKIYLCGITAQPPHREIEKTALGATQTVSWAHVGNITEIVSKLKLEGYQIIAIEQTNQSEALQNFFPQATQKIAYLFGNEVFGLSEEVLPFVDKAIEIPQFGTKHSLNVSVSIGIVLWDYVSKQKGKLI
ncbi:RNA methyltransferase [Hugenholtzia roseola]|uniref:RNA methyltransferase n=1 Tax=Hugenholtzia roseola TaxID=1002 RepID=UPI000424FC8E|nr:RNA methyltransferase [Hugenholtzia roseola]